MPNFLIPISVNSPVIQSAERKDGQAGLSVEAICRG